MRSTTSRTSASWAVCTRACDGRTWLSAPGSLALAGFFLFSGWFSKEDLLGFGTLSGPGPAPWILYAVGVGVNVLTGLYAFRLYFTVFQGEPQTARGFGVKEAGYPMLIPVVILGASRHRRVAAPVPAPQHAPLFSDFLARCSRGRNRRCSTTRPSASRS